MDKILALDTETNGLFIHKGCQAFMVTACSTVTENKYSWTARVNPMTRAVKWSASAIRDIKELIAEHDEIVFHHANFDLQVLNSLGISHKWLFKNFEVHDTMVMSHAYKSRNKHGLKDLCILYLDYSDEDEETLTQIVKESIKIARKLGWRIADKNDLHETIDGQQKEHFRCDYWVPLEIAHYQKLPEDHIYHTAPLKYGSADAERTVCLYMVLKELLLQEELYDQYDSDKSRGLIYPMLDMQLVGVNTKPIGLQKAKKQFETRLSSCITKLQTLSHSPELNPKSHKQLPKILFDKFKFPPVKYGKSGPSTDKDVINALLAEMPISDSLPPKYEFLVSLKEFRKTTSTLQYVNNYIRHSKDNILTSNYGQTRTGTGRLASENPNVTNIGKKNMLNPFEGVDKQKTIQLAAILDIDLDDSFSLRSVFGPRRGLQWTCIDYDQFQLRIFAVASESYELIEGFERGEDIHHLVAKKIFQSDDISPEQRTAAKAVNFGILFGAGPAKIERMAGIRGVYKLFEANLPKAKIYLDAQSRIARTKGYVHTLGGYRLYVPRDTPHAASCYVIQGTEAEVVKTAMTRIHQQNIGPYHNNLMVHDELVFESDRTSKLHLRRIMNTMVEAGTELNIPCSVSAKITKSTWNNLTELAI